MHLNLRRFLKKIDNPLKNDELLREVIKGYSEENSRYLSFSGIENIDSKIDEKSKEEFELYIYNRWKEYMIKSLENYKDDVIKDKDRDEFLMKVVLIKHLTNFNPKSTEEINDFLEKGNGIIEKKYLNFLKDNIYSNKETENPWKNFSSYLITIGEHKTIDQKHKLLINVDTNYLYKFALLFVKKCDELNLPYNFNLLEKYNITNQFEINSDTKNLYTYIELLEKLKEEHQEEFDKNIKQPPILSSHIDNWIGYISNTKNINSSSAYNNTEVRVTIFRAVLNKLNSEWTKDHVDRYIEINNKTIRYRDFLSDLIYKELLKELNKYTAMNNDEKNSIITKKDLESEIVNEVIKEMIDKNIDLILKNINDLSKLDEKELANVETRKKGYTITTTPGIIRKALARQPYILSQQNDDFINQFREEIKVECEKLKILPGKITLDEKVWDELTDKEIEDRKLLHERLVKYRHVYK